MGHAHTSRPRLYRACPAGTLVAVAMRDGTARNGKTKGPAIVWAGYALIEVEGWLGYGTVQAVNYLRSCGS